MPPPKKHQGCFKYMLGFESETRKPLAGGKRPNESQSNLIFIEGIYPQPHKRMKWAQHALLLQVTVYLPEARASFGILVVSLSTTPGIPTPELFHILGSTKYEPDPERHFRVPRFCGPSIQHPLGTQGLDPQGMKARAREQKLKQARENKKKPGAPAWRRRPPRRRRENETQTLAL